MSRRAWELIHEQSDTLKLKRRKFQKRNVEITSECGSELKMSLKEPVGTASSGACVLLVSLSILAPSLSLVSLTDHCI